MVGQSVPVTGMGRAVALIFGVAEDVAVLIGVAEAEAVGVAEAKGVGVTMGVGDGVVQRVRSVVQDAPSEGQQKLCVPQADI